MRLNDLSIKKKLFILYFAALLFPLLIINSLILARYQQSLYDRYYEGISNEMDMKAEQIQKVLSNGYYILQKFYSDRGIYRILDNDYKDNKEFVLIYNDLFNSTVLSFIPFYEDIQSIFFYTSNPTILNAGSIRYVSESIRQEPWYRSNASMNQFAVLSWQGSNQEDDRMDLHLSIIYPLNYYSSYDKYEHLMKVDLKISTIHSILEKSAYNGQMELQDSLQNRILYSGSTPIAYDHFREIRFIEDSSGEPIWTLTGAYPSKPSHLFNSFRDFFYLIFAGILLIYSSLIILWISRSLTIRMNILTGHIQSQDSIRIPLLSVPNRGRDEIGLLIDSYNQMSCRINQLVHDVHRSELNRKQVELDRQKAELHALQSQINPHYLFNTLETIRMKSVLKKEIETAEILQLLSSSFRRMFTWGKDVISVKDSLDFLRDYLQIQKYRWGAQLEYTISCDKELEQWLIPKMIIQPFVENSCRHGFKDENRNYKIRIILEKMGDRLQILIEDDGIGMADSMINEIKSSLHSDEPMNRFVGIRNVFSRLSSRYDGFWFDIVSRKDVGTRVIMHLDPINE